jgi:hypothetical protein
MNEHDEDILGRFMRRFADIEREVPAPPSLAPVQSARLRTRIPVWSVAASVSMAVIAAAVIVSAQPRRPPRASRRPPRRCRPRRGR